MLLPTSSNSLWIHQPLTTDATSNASQHTNVAPTLRCDVCNVDCSSKDVFEKHLQGKKHNRNLQVRNNPTSASLAISNTVNHISFPNQMGTVDGQVVLGTSTLTAGPELEIKKWKVLKSGTTVDSVRVCTICNVVCNSQDVFNKHMAGKKHAIQVSYECGTWLLGYNLDLPSSFGVYSPVRWMNLSCHLGL